MKGHKISRSSAIQIAKQILLNAEDERNRIIEQECSNKRLKMINVHDVYIALLSGLTTKKNEKEIWWDEEGIQCTVELIDVEEERFILRQYVNDVLRTEEEIKCEMNDGIYKLYRSNGKVWHSCEYKNDAKHGMDIWYDPSGKIDKQTKYFNGLIIK